MQAVLEPTTSGQVWANGRWIDAGDLVEDFTFDGIDGEELMGTGTAFETDEAPPVYTPFGS